MPTAPVICTTIMISFSYNHIKPARLEFTQFCKVFRPRLWLQAVCSLTSALNSPENSAGFENLSAGAENIDE